MRDIGLNALDNVFHIYDYNGTNLSLRKILYLIAMIFISFTFSPFILFVHFDM